MSYSIDEGIKDAQDTLAAYEQIKEWFPDAYLDPQRIWVSDSLTPEKCNHIQIGPNDVVRVGTLRGGQLVAIPIAKTKVPGQTVAMLLRRLKDEAPDLFHHLALFAAGARQGT